MFWDLVFKRYSSPFLFLDNLILTHSLCDGIDTIYKQVNEDKLWELYLSIPMKEKSYSDWKNDVISQEDDNEENFEVADDMETIKEKSRNILKNFKPY